MSNIDTAKALLRKGLALGDQELIDMANSMLGSVEQTETWICKKCNAQIDGPKKKSCPLCKGRKFVEYQPVIVESITPQMHKDDISNFTMQKKSMTDESGRKIRYNSAGEIEGTYGKSAPIKVGNTIKAEELANIKEDIAIDSKIQYSDIAVPSRPPVKMTKIKCQTCGDEKMVPANHIGVYFSKTYYVCNTCGSKRR